MFFCIKVSCSWLLVFDHRCLQSIARISWDNRLSNAVVRIRVLGNDDKSIDEVVKLHQLRWLGYVLRMLNQRLPRRAILYGVGVGWKKAKGGYKKNVAQIHEVTDKWTEPCW